MSCVAGWDGPWRDDKSDDVRADPAGLYGMARNALSLRLLRVRIACAISKPASIAPAMAPRMIPATAPLLL
jgi:hypothetical protein